MHHHDNSNNIIFTQEPILTLFLLSKDTINIIYILLITLKVITERHNYRKNFLNILG